jgi:hypothetical protein
VPIFTEASGPVYKREIATHDFMTDSPLLEDPYERQLTEVTEMFRHIKETVFSP